jgi:hypothetical protein
MPASRYFRLRTLNHEEYQLMTVTQFFFNKINTALFSIWIATAKAAFSKMKAN